MICLLQYRPESLREHGVFPGFHRKAHDLRLDGPALCQKAGNVLGKAFPLIGRFQVVGINGQKEQVRPGRFRGKLGNHPAGFFLLRPDHGFRVVLGGAVPVAGFRKEPRRFFPARFPEARPPGSVDKLQLQRPDAAYGKGIADCCHLPTPFLLVFGIQNPVNFLLPVLPGLGEQSVKGRVHVVNRPHKPEPAGDIGGSVPKGQLPFPAGFLQSGV